MSFISRIMRPRAASTTLERLIREVYGGNETASGIDVDADKAMHVSAVFTCVQVLSQSLAQLPLHEYARIDARSCEKAINHYLYGLTHDQPNDWMTSYDFKQLIMVMLLLRGNSLWLKTRMPGQDRVRELLPIHPDLIHEVKQDEKYRIVYSIRRPGSETIDDIPAYKILHFRGLSTNGFWGLNPIEYAREMIGLALATEKHGAKLFSNGARLGGILSHPQKLSEPAYKRLLKSFNENYAAIENAHKTALLEEGMTWQSISMTAEDSQFLETRKYERSEIAGFFRIPSHMINDLEKATFSNVEHLDLSFVKHTLTPWCVSIEQTLKKDLMTFEEKKKYFFKFAVDGLLRGDVKSRNEAMYKAVTGGWLSRNEAREYEDMNPKEGLDEMLEPLNMGKAGENNAAIQK